MKIKYLLLIALFGFTVACNSDKTEDEDSSDEVETIDDSANTGAPEKSELQERLANVVAAESLSQEDLELFASGAFALQNVQKGFEAEMTKMIESEGFDMERYSQIAQMKQMGMDSVLNLSEDEEAGLDRIQASFANSQQQQENRSLEALDAAGIPIEKYQSFVLTIQKDTSLIRQVEVLIAKKNEALEVE